MRNLFQNKYFKYSFYICLFFHLLAVTFSEGYHRPDEHLGIIRVMAFKLGKIPESLLSWEWPTQIRPHFQSWIYYIIAKCFNYLGSENPFHLSFLLRLFSSALGMYSLVLFTTTYSSFLKKERWFNLAYPITFCFWFFPFFHARTSAENLGGSLFLIGLYYFIKNDFGKSLNIKTTLLISALFSISFTTRFHMAFMIGPIILWGLLFKRLNFKNVSTFTLGFLVTFAVTSLADYWAYGNFTFTPYNYFYQNIILKKAAGFGTDPWHYYFRKVFARGYPPLSLTLLIPPIYLWIKRPKSILTWSTLPFFLVHTLVSHKEVRFLFPMATLSPLILCIFLEAFEKQIKKIPKFIIYIMIFENIFLLVLSSTRPALKSINFYKFIYYNKIKSIYSLNVVRDQLFFYQKNKVEIKHIKKEMIPSLEDKYWLLTDRIVHFENCQTRYSDYSKWVRDLIKKHRKKTKVWSLLYCEK